MTDVNLADESLGWMVLAVGGMVIGLGGLLMKRSSPGWWRWAAAALLLVTSGSAWALEWRPQVVNALAGLTGLQVVLAVCNLRAVQGGGARVALALTSPRGLAALMLVAAAGVASWQVVRLDRAFQAEIDQADELFQSPEETVGLSDQPERLALTDMGRSIPLFTTVGLDPIEAKAERDHLRRKGLELHLIQTSTADHLYNCHGWVFTGGRYWVRPQEVVHILKENGYKKQDRPAPDDVAVFLDSKSQVLHSALVRSVTPDGTVLLESKWGQLGRYLHNDRRHAYSQATCRYYRSERVGHLLRGLDGSQRVSNQLAN